MPDQSWTAVDRYLTDLFVPPDDVLDTVLATSAAAGLPEIQVSPAQGKLLHVLARSHGVGSILEIGTLGGYSTIWLARALPPNGRLVTLEFEAKHAAVARANIARAGLADRVEIRIGPALESLPQLAAEGRGPFDLIFIDADKEGYPEYLDWALALSCRGSLIIADNVVRQGAVIDLTDARPDMVAIRRFNEKLAADPRVIATVLQVVGSKGHDGLALALVVDGVLGS
jgi:predicted O-methyltransferase YrrM